MDKLEYNKDYLEFQRLANKIIGIKEWKVCINTILIYVEQIVKNVMELI
jgi:hypothetical protein